jgi:MFS transporter, YNFM family, putative membrane transport protein
VTDASVRRLPRLRHAIEHEPPEDVHRRRRPGATGSAGSFRAGLLADRVGRRPVMLGSILLAAAGLALTLPDSVPLIGVGLLVFTVGFFGAHSVASGWVGARATTARAQASALYLCAFYLGSSTGGSAGGIAFQHAGWTGTGLYVLALLSLGLLIAATLDLSVRLVGKLRT